MLRSARPLRAMTIRNHHRSDGVAAAANVLD
jgi:hypothetical protein